MDEEELDKEKGESSSSEVNRRVVSDTNSYFKLLPFHALNASS
jgi:hypothetical protein